MKTKMLLLAIAIGTIGVSGYASEGNPAETENAAFADCDHDLNIVITSDSNFVSDYDYLITPSFAFNSDNDMAILPTLIEIEGFHNGFTKTNDWLINRQYLDRDFGEIGIVFKY